MNRMPLRVITAPAASSESVVNSACTQHTLPPHFAPSSPDLKAISQNAAELQTRKSHFSKSLSIVGNTDILPVPRKEKQDQILSIRRQSRRIADKTG
jgi:hypothetical protein